MGRGAGTSQAHKQSIALPYLLWVNLHSFGQTPGSIFAALAQPAFCQLLKPETVTETETDTDIEIETATATGANATDSDSYSSHCHCHCHCQCDCICSVILQWHVFTLFCPKSKPNPKSKPEPEPKAFAEHTQRGKNAQAKVQARPLLSILPL